MMALSWEQIEEIAGEDPDDRAIRIAHGFSPQDDWQDDTLLCRNGCGISYEYISAHKIRECHAEEEEDDG